MQIICLRGFNSIVILNFLTRLSNWFRRKITSKKFYFVRRWVAGFFDLNRQLARIYELPDRMGSILILGRGASLRSTVDSLNIDKYDLILVVNECDYLLTDISFEKIISSKKPLIQYLNNAEVVHSISKTKKLNLWGFWLSVPREDGTWREGLSKRRFRGPESLGAIPRYASIEMIHAAEKYLPVNAGLLCILQAILFHQPKEIDVAGFDFYKNTQHVHIDNALLEKKELPLLSSLSSDYESAYLRIVQDHPQIMFNLYR